MTAVVQFTIRNSQFAMELVGWLITVIAVTGVILNNQHRRGCFLLWLVSNALSAGVHFSAGLPALGVRDVIFFALAIHGLIAWSKSAGKARRKE